MVEPNKLANDLCFDTSESCFTDEKMQSLLSLEPRTFFSIEQMWNTWKKSDHIQNSFIQFGFYER